MGTFQSWTKTLLTWGRYLSFFLSCWTKIYRFYTFACEAQQLKFERFTFFLFLFLFKSHAFLFGSKSRRPCRQTASQQPRSEAGASATKYCRGGGRNSSKKAVKIESCLVDYKMFSIKRILFGQAKKKLKHLLLTSTNNELFFTIKS